jgi:hypothetical protein
MRNSSNCNGEISENEAMDNVMVKRFKEEKL